jgi:hypothetical protein
MNWKAFVRRRIQRNTCSYPAYLFQSIFSYEGGGPVADYLPQSV